MSSWRAYRTGTVHRLIGAGKLWTDAEETACGQILPRDGFRVPRPGNRICRSCLRTWGVPLAVLARIAFADVCGNCLVRDRGECFLLTWPDVGCTLYEPRRKP